ncbi:hypothetical protein D1872_279410 [compost metagenome]
MREMGLKAKIRRKRHIHSRKVTGSENRIAENVINRDFHAQAPNQKWVTDVTYIQTTEGCYTSLQSWIYLTIKSLVTISKIVITMH